MNTSNDAIITENSRPQDVIFQLQERIKETRKTYSTLTTSHLNNLDLARRTFEAAKVEWERMQRQCRISMNIAQSREREELHRLQSKILLYRILEKHGPDICVEAYKIATSAGATDYDTIKIKADTVVSEGEDPPPDILKHQIAWDLLQGRLGLFPSPDAEEWVNLAQRSLSGGMVKIDIGNVWLPRSSIDILGEFVETFGDEENPGSFPDG